MNRSRGTALVCLFSALSMFCAGAATHRVDLRNGVAPPTAIAVGDELSVTFADGVLYTVNVDAELPSFAGARTFAAHLGDGVSASSLVISDTSFTIEVRDIAESRLWRGYVSDGNASVETVDLSAVRRGGCIEVDTPDPESGENEVEEPKKSTPPVAAVTGNPFDDNVVAPAPTMVDIMLVFDSGARTWVEGKAAYGGSITNFAIAQVAKMNQVLKNTDLHTNFWFRLVDVATVDGRWTTIDNTILPAMRTGVMNASGIWAEVAARREACGADVVSLIVDTGSAYGTTGIGYITHGTSYSMWVNTYRTWCYSCCAIRSVENDYTLSHEVGHNMGLTHSPTLATWSKVGTFDYSNGYNITNANDGKHYNTIMAYNYDRYFSDYIEIPYYSSPDYAFKGVPLGTAISNDCTRALRQTCLGIADWHAQTIPLPSDVAFSPNASSAYRITMSTSGGYEIRYTTDGSTPTRESALYESPLILTTGEMTVKAVAVVDGETLGAVATKTYGAAVELGEYAWLEDTAENNWSQGNWNRNDGSYIYYYFWNASSDKTAVLDIDGTINVDRDISLGTLVVGGPTNMEIAVADKPLFATNLEVVANATLSGSNYSFERWWLHPESTLVLSPGVGQTFILANNLALSYPTATFAVTNGTVVAGAGGSAAGQFGFAALHVFAGGTLKIAGGGWNTGSTTETALTVDKGGTLEIAAVDDIHRNLVMDGGTLSITKSGRAASFYNLKMSVTDDSTITDNGGTGEIWIRTADARVDVANGKTLTFDAALTKPSDNGYQSLGKGLVKTGKGEIRFLDEISHSGTNTISEGTLSVCYNSTTTNGLGWVLAGDATLKIEKGASLQVPSLALSHGASLVLPAASSAPLSVSAAVDLTHVALTLTDADDLSYGATYRLMSSSEDITGSLRAYKSEFPALADGLAWKLYVADNTLFAKVTSVAEAAEPVVLVSNNPDLVLEIPDDGIVKCGNAIKIETAPLVVDGLNAKAVAITMDVEIPIGEQSADATLCSWNVGGNIIRCVRRADGTVDCFYGTSSHVDNGVNDVELVPGRHTVNVGYYSLSNDDYGGTFVYVDGVLAYRGARLRWSNDSVSLVTFGATAAETPASPYNGLVVRGVSVIEPFSELPVSGMTASSGEVTYNYVVPTNKVLAAYNKLPSVFGSAPGGGFTVYSTCLDAAFPGNYDSISVSVVASFPTDRLGALMGIWTKNTSTGAAFTSQVDYNGDGTFATRYNGYVSQNPAIAVGQPDATVDSPHLYTFTYAKNEGFRFYQDGVQILEATDGFADKGYLAYYKVTFGCGPWNGWTTSYDDSANPMPNFKVYASHIALGTDEVLASIEPVIESLAFDAAYDNMSIAEKLSYLPEYQTATGVSAPPQGEGMEELPVVDILVAFDNGAQAYVANKGQTLAEFAEAQIAKMNAALATNKLDRCYSYSLAGVCKVDATYTRIGEMSGDLVAGSGPLVTLRSNRELLGADTVTLLVDNESDATLGYGCPLGSSTDVASCHDDAFSVCSIRAVDTGKQHTMLHENAHNMGCGHARAQSDPASPFSYGRGYYFKDGDVTRHTIMAYGGDNDASWYFSTSSDAFGFKLGDATNDNARVLRETCGAVAKWREGAAIDFAGAAVEGAALQTSARFPWFVEGDAIRSFKQTNYVYQSTMPLKATVTGPKVLTFKHKSYFGGKSVADNNYSHFDVLLDDSPVIVQSECTNSWTSALVDIPEGEHEVVFVFSQRFAMNNPGDYKDGAPEADDAVWLKDIRLVSVPEGESFRIPGTAAFITAGDALEEWLEDENFELMYGGFMTWPEFMEETGANGYVNWMNYVLGLSASDPTAKLKAKISFDAQGRVVVSVEDSIPNAPAIAGVKVAATLLETSDLNSWPSEGVSADGKSVVIEKSHGHRFYKIVLSIQEVHGGQ